METHKLFLPGDNLTDAYSIRTKVFVEEQRFPAEIEIDDIDPTAHHIVIYLDSLPVATGRVFVDQSRPEFCHIGRVAVLPQHRGGGMGVRLMRLLEQQGRDMGLSHATLGAQKRVEAFYLKLGYTPYGEPFFEDYCEHINMLKKL